jgi:hypothetical protein
VLPQAVGIEGTKHQPRHHSRGGPGPERAQSLRGLDTDGEPVAALIVPAGAGITTTPGRGRLECLRLPRPRAVTGGASGLPRRVGEVCESTPGYFTQVG